MKTTEKTAGTKATKTPKAKAGTTIVVEVPSWTFSSDEKHPDTVTITVGKSIRMTGRTIVYYNPAVPTVEKMPSYTADCTDDRIEAMFHDRMEATAWLEKLSRADSLDLGNLLRSAFEQDAPAAAKYVAQDWVEEHGGNRTWVEWFPQGVLNFRLEPRTSEETILDRTFKVGDTAMYDGYNFAYTGVIESITPKTVVVSDHGRRHRMTTEQFVRKNRSLDLRAESERYHDWVHSN